MTHNFIRIYVQSLMYADDAAFVFPDAGTLRGGARKLRAHFARWSLSFHVGKNRRKGLVGIESKSAMMFFPGKPLPGETKVSYDDAAVMRDIAKASSAFGASRQYAFKNRMLPFSLRAKIYSAPILPILLWGEGGGVESYIWLPF